jgi:hypothetical protein
MTQRISPAARAGIRSAAKRRVESPLCAGGAQPIADAAEMQAPLGQPIDVEFAGSDTTHPADRHIVAAEPECGDARGSTSPPILSTTMSTPLSPVCGAMAAPKPSLPVRPRHRDRSFTAAKMFLPSARC